MNVDEAKGVLLRYAFAPSDSLYPIDYTEALNKLEDVGLVNHLPVSMSGRSLQERALYHLGRLTLIEKAIDDELRASQANITPDLFGRP